MIYLGAIDRSVGSVANVFCSEKFPAVFDGAGYKRCVRHRNYGVVRGTSSGFGRFVDVECFIHSRSKGIAVTLRNHVFESHVNRLNKKAFGKRFRSCGLVQLLRTGPQ